MSDTGSMNHTQITVWAPKLEYPQTSLRTSEELCKVYDELFKRDQALSQSSCDDLLTTD